MLLNAEKPFQVIWCSFEIIELLTNFIYFSPTAQEEEEEEEDEEDSDSDSSGDGEEDGEKAKKDTAAGSLVVNEVVMFVATLKRLKLNAFVVYRKKA